MKLQLGQTICWDGVQQIVTAVSEIHARIATRSGKDALRSVFGKLQDAAITNGKASL